ncbi:MAG: hypothetical protein GW911_30135 [Armatimonadetes bacterium]|nr:hypothetical protein [Armatimonadota bacterium]PIY48301.1 MAG: hypothetical protein COZ05_03535 [Armatimonadetes bacterium CG_4_10_14_3_um_filter_59_10]
MVHPSRPVAEGLHREWPDSERLGSSSTWRRRSATQSPLAVSGIAAARLPFVDSREGAAVSAEQPTEAAVLPAGGLVIACLVVAACCGARALIYAVPTRFHAPSVADWLYLAGLAGFALVYGWLLARVASRRRLSLAAVALLSYATCALYTLPWLLVQALGRDGGPAFPAQEAAGKILLDQVNVVPVSLCLVYFLATTRRGRCHLRHLTGQAAGDLHLGAGSVVFVFVLPVVAMSGYLLWQFVDFPNARIFAEEDGIAEWLTAAGFLGGTLMAALAAARLLRAKRQALAAFYVVLLLGGVLVAGEEASWGSRSLSFGQGLRENNIQGEVSLHNLRGVQEVVTIYLGYAASLVALVIGGAAILTVSPRPPAWLRAVHWVLPHYVFLPVFAALSANDGRLAPILWNVLPDKGNFDEVQELVVGLAFVAVVYLNVRRLGLLPDAVRGVAPIRTPARAADQTTPVVSAPLVGVGPRPVLPVAQPHGS